MQKVDAPLNQVNYDAQLYVPRIVNYWNEEKQSKCFRVFIFAATGHYRPIYKLGADDYNVVLILYHNNDHFDALRSGGSLFGKPYFLECESTYDIAATHKKSCRRRCINCTRLGPTYPCKKVQEYFRDCQGCQKTFINKDCYDYHVRHEICNKEKRCEECGIIYNLAKNSDGGREGHHCLE